MTHASQRQSFTKWSRVTGVGLTAVVLGGGGLSAIVYGQVESTQPASTQPTTPSSSASATTSPAVASSSAVPSTAPSTQRAGSSATTQSAALARALAMAATRPGTGATAGTSSSVSASGTAGGAPTTAPLISPSLSTRNAYRDRYAILSEHNIFMKERGRREPVRTGTGNTGVRRPAPTVEQGFVLTGIVFEDGAFRAYIEDVNKGAILRLSVGDAVARGQISEIQIDAIAYESAGASKWVELGSNLGGSQVSSVSDARISAAAAGGASGVPTTTNTANLSPEERMRLRRIQEQQRINGGQPPAGATPGGSTPTPPNGAPPPGGGNPPNPGGPQPNGAPDANPAGPTTQPEGPGEGGGAEAPMTAPGGMIPPMGVADAGPIEEPVQVNEGAQDQGQQQNDAQQGGGATPGQRLRARR